MVKKKQKKIMHWSLLVLLIPSIVYVFIFCYMPMYGIQIAFKDYNSWQGIFGSPWVGFKHFTNFFSQPIFWTLIKNTLVLSLYSLAVFPTAIIFALMVNEVGNSGAKRVVQTISYAPFFISTVVVVGICFNIFNSSSGIVNTIIDKLGGDRIPFMGSSKYFPHIYVWSMVWQTLGWSAIIYVASLANVSPELHEAAMIDGATRLQRIWHINLPAIVPIATISFIMNVGNILNVGFEKVFLMQTDGNLESSEIISTYVYKLTLQSSAPKYSFGTAVGLFNSVVNLVIITLANTISKKLGQASLW